MIDFGGNKINFVQAGLGTNCTFIQNLAGKKSEVDNVIRSLLSLTSATDPAAPLSPIADPSCVSGISVEPVASLINKLSRYMDKLPNVHLLQAALGAVDTADVDVYAFTQEMYDKLALQVAPVHRKDLEHHMQYLLNMSHMGIVHPQARSHVQKLRQKFNIDISVEKQKSEVWTWNRLVETFKFKGCEVLLLDTEGHDVQILRSMMQHCVQHPGEWPNFIQFESMGLCDALEGKGAETRIVRDLEMYGYVAIMLSNWNTYLIHESVMGCPKIKKWVHGWFCDICKQYGAATPFTSDHVKNFCATCSKCLTTEQRKIVALMPRCGNPECEYPANPNPEVSDGFCCERCEGRFKGEAWALGSKKKNMHTAYCTSKDRSFLPDPRVLTGVSTIAANGDYGPVGVGTQPRKCKNPEQRSVHQPWLLMREVQGSPQRRRLG